jgi:hypothetical protein
MQIKTSGKIDVVKTWPSARWGLGFLGFAISPHLRLSAVKLFFNCRVMAKACDSR